MDLFPQQRAGQIVFLIKHLWKKTPSSSLLKLNLSSLQVVSGCNRHILDRDYKYIQRWLHTLSWIRDTWKFISEHIICTSYIGPLVKPKRQQDTCLMTHCADTGYTKSQLRDINRCKMKNESSFYATYEIIKAHIYHLDWEIQAYPFPDYKVISGLALIKA